MIHAVSRFGVRRAAVSHPLPADHISDQPTRLHRLSRGQPERAAVNTFRSVRLRSVKRNVIDPENARPGDSALRVCANRQHTEGKHYDGCFHKADSTACRLVVRLIPTADRGTVVAACPLPPAAPTASNAQLSESPATGCC